MESAEFMAAEGNDIFWNYIDEYLRKDAPSPLANDKEQYEFIFKILEEKDLLSQARKNLFKLSLSFRQYNPKVELYRHLVERVTEKNQHECLKNSGWIIFNSQIFCDIKSLEASLGSDSMITEENVQSFDHVYPNFKEDSLTVYHYNQLGSASFKDLHAQLKRLADSGKIRYVFRHNPPTTDRKVFLQGFGLEMALKSTEYKVIDDRIKTESKEENDTDKPKITPLPKEALETIGVKTVQYIMSHPSPIKALEEVSQNFPYLSNKISLLPLDDAIDEKIKKTHNTLGEGISMILINGRHVNVENIDIFTMLDIIREEIDKSESLKSLKLDPSDVSRILNLVTPPKKENIYKIPLKGVHFISDIEVDAKYEKWAPSIRTLVQPSFPGQMKFIRKNILTSFFIFDPASYSSLAMVNEMRGAISQGFPAKFGILFYADKNSPTYETSKKIAQIFMHIFEGGSQHRAMFFLYKLHELGAGGFTDKVLREAASSSIVNAGITEKLIFSSKDYEGALEKDLEFLASLGLDKKIKLPVLFLNGRLLSAENIPQTLYSNSFVEYNKLTTKFYQGEINEETNIYEALTGDGISKYNVHIQPINTDDMEFISLMPSRTVTPFLKDLVWYSNPETDSIVKKFNYILSFDDLGERSLQQLRNFVDYIIHLFGNTARFSFVCKDCSVNVKQHLYAVGRNFESKNWEFLKEVLATSDFESKFEQIATKVGIKYADLKKKIEEEKNFEKTLQIQSDWLRNTLKHKDGEITIVLNGRVERFTPDEDLLSGTEIFSLSESESFARTNTLSNIIDTSSFVDVDIDDQTSELRSDLLMQISSMIGVEEVVQKITRNDMYHFETFIEISAKNNSAEFTLVGILNPLSDSAQKFSSIFLHLMEYFNVQWKLTLNPHSKYDDIPLKEFYRFVFVPELKFDKDGNIDQDTLVADFENLPEESLFTMNLDSSDSLMINAKTAKYDLDNIMLKNVAENTLYALYELRHIIVEGNCYELATGNAPNGLQLVLKSNINGVEEKHDTVVMQNHGYFQLKSNPGVWSLDLAEGKSGEIYEFVDKQQHSIAVNTFNGKIFKLDVNKKPGMQEKQLFEDKKGEEDKGIWNSISNMWGTKNENDSKNETIHIFSVASGHLYERFMSIMMLSVVNSTKSNVKFWIIENFVSPEFKLFVPKLAKAHNFEIQFITYNWPRWLIAQKEKQRKIWAYKILFLDVLFPLDINRIIFVDADQTVRGDIKELWDLDIGGAPYAYVPFCPADSRPETKGFRFWDSGFWAEHLGGKPYHISALYRVDLDTFRRKRSGDFLRSTYNNLSRDKNSLANLDQDLPNYLQHMVPIFSLPQEWLWCETWCSDESKKSAKTIDLCNNPLTKTPKLENALRIVHEWKDYDEYLKNFRQNSQN